MAIAISVRVVFERSGVPTFSRTMSVSSNDKEIKVQLVKGRENVYTMKTVSTTDRHHSSSNNNSTTVVKEIMVLTKPRTTAMVVMVDTEITMVDTATTMAATATTDTEMVVMEMAVMETTIMEMAVMEMAVMVMVDMAIMAIGTMVTGQPTILAAISRCNKTTSIH